MEEFCELPAATDAKKGQPCFHCSNLENEPGVEGAFHGGFSALSIFFQMKLYSEATPSNVNSGCMKQMIVPKTWGTTIAWFSFLSLERLTLTLKMKKRHFQFSLFSLLLGSGVVAITIFGWQQLQTRDDQNASEDDEVTNIFAQM